MDNGTKLHFLEGIKIPELEAAVNVVWAQQEKYGTDFDANMPYLGQMVMKKCLIMQPAHITKTGSQPVRPKVSAFMGKIGCKKYPKAVLNSMTKEQQMQVHKLCGQQGTKPNMKQTSVDARNAALEAKFEISSKTE